MIVKSYQYHGFNSSITFWIQSNINTTPRNKLIYGSISLNLLWRNSKKKKMSTVEILCDSLDDSFHFRVKNTVANKLNNIQKLFHI